MRSFLLDFSVLSSGVLACASGQRDPRGRGGDHFRGCGLRAAQRARCAVRRVPCRTSALVGGVADTAAVSSAGTTTAATVAVAGAAAGTEAVSTAASCADVYKSTRV